MLYGFPDSWCIDLDSSQSETLQGTAQSVRAEGVPERGSNGNNMLHFVCTLSGRVRQT